MNGSRAQRQASFIYAYPMSPSLSTFWIAIIATVVLSSISLGYLLIGWLRKRSGRVLLRGLGLVLLPVGLMVLGWMELGVDAVKYLVDWANTHPMSPRIMIGLALAGLGLGLFIVGTMMAPIIGEQAKKRRAEIVAKRAALSGPPPAKPAAAGTPQAGAKPAAQPVPAAAKPAAGPAATSALDPATDDEIDEILRRHGIQ